MPKKADPKLHVLIRNMDKSEKRYFKLFASRQGDDVLYVRLFDIIEKQETYDEKAVKDLLSKDRLTATFAKNFASAKKSLFDNVVRSLQQYRYRKGSRRILREMLDAASILEEKGLYLDARRSLKKAKKYAYAHDNFRSVLEIIDRERADIQRTENRHYRVRVQECCREHQRVAKAMNNVETYNDLYFRIFSMTRMHHLLPTPEITSELGSLMSHELLQAPERALSVTALRIYHTIHACNERMRGNIEKAVRHYHEHLRLWESHPEHCADNVQGHIIAIANLAVLYLRFQMYREYVCVTRKFASVKPLDHNDEAELFQNDTYLRLLYDINTDNLEDAVTMGSAIEAGIKKYVDRINMGRRVALFHNLLVAHFLMENYAGALVWANRIVNINKSDKRIDIQNCARLLRLIILYELSNDGDYEHLERILNSAGSLFRNSKKMGVFQRKVKRFFKRLINAADDAERIVLYSDMQRDLAKMLDSDDISRFALGLAEFLYWLESMLQGKSIRDIMRNRNGVSTQLGPPPSDEECRKAGLG